MACGFTGARWCLDRSALANRSAVCLVTDQGFWTDASKIKMG
jgi:hypothetical protein